MPGPKQDAINRTPDTETIGVAAGGLAGGALGGAAAGSFAGPVGTLVGATLGAIAGGLAGKAAADQLDPALEDEFWRQSYQAEPYYEAGYTYDDYAPAYRSGYQARARLADPLSFDAIESDLEADFYKQRAGSRLDWDKARPAARASYERACVVYRPQ